MQVYLVINFVVDGPPRNHSNLGWNDDIPRTYTPYNTRLGIPREREYRGGAADAPK